MSSETGRFLRFCVVGASNTLLTLLAFAALSRLAVAPAAASACAFAVGAVNGYVLNRSWTFRARGGAGTVIRYVAVQAVGALTSAIAITVVKADFDLRRLLAECMVIPFVTLLTYTLARRVVFHPDAGVA